MKMKTKGTNLKTTLLSPSKRKRNIELEAPLYFYVTFRRTWDISVCASCAHKACGTDKRPNLEAKSRPGARLNCSVVITAFGNKISVELSPLCEDVRLSPALPVLLWMIWWTQFSSCVFEFLSYLQPNIKLMVVIPTLSNCAFSPTFHPFVDLVSHDLWIFTCMCWCWFFSTSFIHYPKLSFFILFLKLRMFKIKMQFLLVIQKLGLDEDQCLKVLL